MIKLNALKELSRDELKAISGGFKYLSISNSSLALAPECGDVCDPTGKEPALTCGGACPKCASEKCSS